MEEVKEVKEGSEVVFWMVVLVSPFFPFSPFFSG